MSKHIREINMSKRITQIEDLFGERKNPVKSVIILPEIGYFCTTIFLIYQCQQ